MKIAQKLTLLGLLPLALLLAIGMVALTTYESIEDAREMHRVAGILETRVFALNTLTYDYLHGHEERARIQWWQNHEALGHALDEAEAFPVPPYALAQMRRDHAELAIAFNRLAEHYALYGDSRNPVWQERESWLVARLLLRTQATFTDAMKLRESAEQRIDQEQRFFLFATFTLLTLVGGLAALFAWRMGTTIRASLRRLHRDAETIAAGNLDYRATPLSQDEHGELAKALNAMAHNLETAQRQLVQSEKLSALGTLAAGVAHELNNPLMGIMGYVDLSQRQSRDPEVKEMLVKASHELERMRDLLKNMLGFSRPVAESASVVSLPAAGGAGACAHASRIQGRRHLGVY